MYSVMKKYLPLPDLWFLFCIFVTLHLQLQDECRLASDRLFRNVVIWSFGKVNMNDTHEYECVSMLDRKHAHYTTRVGKSAWVNEALWNLKYNTKAVYKNQWLFHDLHIMASSTIQYYTKLTRVNAKCRDIERFCMSSLFKVMPTYLNLIYSLDFE